MEHEPFKTWLVDRSGLNSDENEILDDHLAVCPECAATALKIQNLDKILGNNNHFTPSPGFTRRFLSTLPERREREQQRQVRKWMIGLGIALILNIILIITASIITRTTSTWLVNLAILYGNIDGFFQEISMIIHTASLVVPSSLWIAAVMMILAWGAAGVGLWMFAMRRIHILGVPDEK
jgi:anti-sigma factor RsiW